MSTSFSLPQRAKLVSALSPATDAAGRTGAYVSLKNAHKAWLVVHMTQGNAATVAVSLSQATAVAGTSAKATTALIPIWSNLDCAATDTLVSRTAAANYTTDAGVKIKQVVFEIDPAFALDVANGFRCVAPVTGASNAANITSALWYIEPRYREEPIPSAIVD